MNRREARKIQEALNHFAHGGDLWWWCYGDNRWYMQTAILFGNYPCNIIEDEHFEFRKAQALGAEIEQIKWNTCNWGEFESFYEGGKYRIKKDSKMSEKQERTYEVVFGYTEYGKAYVKATSEEEAIKKIDDHLADEGLDNLDYKCQDRDYSAEGAIEIEGAENGK